MRNKVAKQLKRYAESSTVGQSKKVTKRFYRKLKKEHISKLK